MRVGVIGAGWIAEEHVAILRGLEGIELAAVCDVDEARAAELAAGAAVYTDWRELLERESPDAVFVCTPPMLHREMTVDALGRGIHVYLEKPVARGLDDARAIVEAAAASEAVCAVGYQWRAVEVLDDLRKALDGQEIGLLIGIGTGPTKSRPWFLNRSEGGGNLLERASHGIDLARAIAGEVVAVQTTASAVPLAQSAGESGDIEDAAAITLRFANGGVGTSSIAWTRDGLPGRYSVDVLASESSFRLELDPTFTLRGTSRGAEIDAGMTQHPIERGVRRFFEAAEAGDKSRVFCTPADAAGTLAVVIACEEALASGATVAVDPISVSW
ncbi:MAG: myo-inositol 2-dehydrogenase / D-chiro-inositol 1-dehydrogenase [Gaiellaceae bacterium]|nr:myo-inositol 2-dehydrogenase / D-chiro-inositol 1-dehydrogenase [Gaiellaceae bacterium]